MVLGNIPIQEGIKAAAALNKSTAAAVIHHNLRGQPQSRIRRLLQLALDRFRRPNTLSISPQALEYISNANARLQKIPPGFDLASHKLLPLFSGIDPYANGRTKYFLQGNGTLIHTRWYSTELKKVVNKRPRGIVPIGEDYGGYDENKHEEFEQDAEKRQAKIKRIKKIGSTVVFGTIFGTVMWARNRKQRILEENTKNCVFLPKNPLYTGSHDTFCIMKNDSGSEQVVLPGSIVVDGTMKYISNMEFRSGDVVVASFPKTGTTWVQEIAYLIKNDLDYKKAASNIMEDRFPFLEYPYPGVKSVDKSPSPRFIKTHLPYSFLPKHSDRAKIIYITRNPKDTVVSYYHFARMLAFSGFSGSFSDFVQMFENDQVPYSPFFGHIESYLNHKDDPNVLILTYEELSKDPADVIQKIANFLEKPLTEDEIKCLVNHTTFKRMSANPSVNYEHWDDLGFRKLNESPFMRKGEVGNWKNYFGERENEKFETWIRDKNSINFKFAYT